MEYSSNYHLIDFLANYAYSPIGHEITLTKQDIQNLLEEIQYQYYSQNKKGE